MSSNCCYKKVMRPLIKENIERLNGRKKKWEDKYLDAAGVSESEYFQNLWPTATNRIAKDTEKAKSYRSAFLYYYFKTLRN